jgi:hypothetical protein
MLNRFPDKTGRYTLIIFLIMVSFAVHGQTVQFHADVGFATYSYNDLKAFQDDLRGEMGLSRSAILDEFPPYFTFSGGLDVQWTFWTVGAEFGHGSTAGRIFYQDYSGKFVSDMNLSYDYLGVVPGIVVYRNNPWFVVIGTKINLVFGKLKLRNSLTLGTQSDQQNDDFKMMNLGLQPYLQVRRYVGSVLYFQGNLGYEMQTQDVATWTEDSKRFLVNSNNDPVHVQGNGLRFSLSAGVRLNKKAE